MLGDRMHVLIPAAATLPAAAKQARRDPGGPYARACMRPAWSCPAASSLASSA